METKFVRVAETLCPERDFEIRKNQPVYFNSNISNQIVKRDQLFKEAWLANDKTKREKLWSKATRKRQEIKSLLRKAKRNYVTSELETHKNNPKKYWRAMNSFMNRGKTSAKIDEIILSNGAKAHGMVTAEATNSYFCKVGSNLAKDIVPSEQKFTTEGVKCKFKWGFSIMEHEVETEVLKLSNAMSSGLMHLGCRILNPCLKMSIGEHRVFKSLC